MQLDVTYDDKSLFPSRSSSSLPPDADRACILSLRSTLSGDLFGLMVAEV
jgi:hypothetical protein